MKNRRFWNITPLELLLAVALVLSVCSMAFYNRILFYIELGVAVLLIIYAVWHLGHIRHDIRRYLGRIAGKLNQTDQDALSAFPLPVSVVSANGEVIWYNDLFRGEVLDGNEAYGESVGSITDGLTVQNLQDGRRHDIRFGTRRYTVYTSPLEIREATLYIL